MTDEDVADSPKYVQAPFRFMAIDPNELYLNTVQVCDILSVTRGTWTGWVSRGYAPKEDVRWSGSPFWTITTIVEYARNAPGGRLGYPVGS